MNLKKLFIPIVLLYVVFLLIGCGIQQARSPDHVSLSNSIMQIYNSAYSDYMETLGFNFIDERWVKIRSPDLTETQKEELRAKKRALVMVEPLIKSYNLYIERDQIPPPDLINQIMDILDMFTDAVIERDDYG